MADALLTDLYQLTMLEAYHARGMDDKAVFELYARRLPPERGFVMVAGLGPALDYLESLRFNEQQLQWLAMTGRFSEGFLDSLASFRFGGDVWAVPEGTVLFADEPWLRVEARLPEAQFVESRLINLLHLSSLIATKAARCVLAAGGKALMDFGMRRAHGAEAALLAARSAMIAGFTATATVEAGRLYGLPLAGTMAHSYVQAMGDEVEAFRHYAKTYPQGTTLLIDTYDAVRGAERVAALWREGLPVGAVRIDSGDLAEEARKVRAVLDAAGADAVKIVVSGNLDEYAIEELVRSGAPIDAFGVGTRLDTSADAPTLDAVYKLESYAGRATRKRSPGKATWPGAKQVWRKWNSRGQIERDRLACVAEGPVEQGEHALLVPVMRAGVRLGTAPSVAQLAATARANLIQLPPGAAALRDPRPVAPEISAALQSLATELDLNGD